MTIEGITKAIEKIKSVQSDDEMAHSMEDGLRDDFIKYISEGGSENLEEKARLILTTDDIDFARWCA